VNYMPTGKIGLQFKRRFWEEMTASTAGSSHRPRHRKSSIRRTDISRARAC
jgi:monoamine oxidase